jgi:hypothetical protein
VVNVFFFTVGWLGPVPTSWFIFIFPQTGDTFFLLKKKEKEEVFFPTDIVKF